MLSKAENRNRPLTALRCVTEEGLEPRRESEKPLRHSISVSWIIFRNIANRVSKALIVGHHGDEPWEERAPYVCREINKICRLSIRRLCASWITGKSMSAL